MIAEGREAWRTAPHMAFVPSTAMFFTVLALNLIGDEVRAMADPRQGAR